MEHDLDGEPFVCVHSLHFLFRIHVWRQDFGSRPAGQLASEAMTEATSDDDQEMPLAETPACLVENFKEWLMQRWSNVNDQKVFDDAGEEYASWCSQRFGGLLHLLSPSAATNVGWRPVCRDTVIRNSSIFMLVPRR